VRTVGFKEAEMTEEKVPNVALDLLRIHAIITRGLAVATENSGVFAQEGFPAASTREGFTCYVRSLVSVVHGHHLTEDELVFPHFRARLPDAPFDLLMTQHQELVHLLDKIKAAIEEVAANPQAAAALSKLNGALKRTGETWHPHIGIEQDHLAPDKVGPLLAPEEHIRLSRLFAEHGRKRMAPGHLVAPFLLYNLPTEERAMFARGMPVVLTRLLVPWVWRKRWAPMKPFLLS
jgi:hypothetical protein